MEGKRLNPIYKRWEEFELFFAENGIIVKGKEDLFVFERDKQALELGVKILKVARELGGVKARLTIEQYDRCATEALKEPK